MSEEMLTRWVDPFKLAQMGASIKGGIPTKDFTRWLAVVDQVLSLTVHECEFHMDSPSHLPKLAFELSSEIEVTCQRCLKQVSLALSAKSEIFFTKKISGDKEVNFDCLEVPDIPWDLYQFLEDELLLELPDSPKHPESQCHPPVNQSIMQSEKSKDVNEESHAIKASNPFEILKKMRE